MTWCPTACCASTGRLAVPQALTPVQGALLTRPRPKGIFWAGIGGGSRIGGPDLCVAGPKVTGATVTGILGAEGSRVGGRAGGAGRGGRSVEGERWRSAMRVGSGAAGVRPAQARAEVGAGGRA